MTSLPEASFQTKSLREQVYEYLREALSARALAPGDTIRMDALCEKLGISRTPLREAVLQLEWEGFVTIYPRRGIVVRGLTLDTIRYLYEIIGALESSTIPVVFPLLNLEHLAAMQEHNHAMRDALNHDDFQAYYSHNIALHDCLLSLSDNRELNRIISVSRQRLYDFPRKTTFIKEWELRSLDEHQKYIDLLLAGDSPGASRFIRDVHWSYAVQEPFIRQYYASEIDNHAT